MKTILDLLKGVKILQTVGDTASECAQLAFDSRKVSNGTCFFALRGTQVDGHLFIEKAITQGASVVVCETLPETLAANTTFVQVEDTTLALAMASNQFYDCPSEQLQLVGITGTNGKTTTATLLFDLFTALGYRCGLISTVEYRVADAVLPSTHTTPDPLALNLLFAEMLQAGCKYAFMEVSSHAIHQNRIAGLTFSGGIFSNITHDHLDYHKTFDAYIKAKKQFFDQLPAHAFALTNIDDKNGNVMMQNTKATVSRYGLKRMCDFKGKIIENAITGLHLDINGQAMFARLIGEFNAYNLLACYATAVLLGADKNEVLVALSGLKAAEGRFDYLRNEKTAVVGIVDYAHTPDALEKVLETIHALRKKGQRIITITGCGGDRDPKKRFEMGRIAAKMSEIVVLTADNPRSEDPLAIIAQMREGIAVEFLPKVLEIADRRMAIKTAVQLAQRGDIILIAGKGHEKYQDIMGVKHPFDDKEELLKLFAI